MAQRKPLKLFFSYSHEDEKLRNSLAKHLALLERKDVITSWSDRKIPDGAEWKGAIDENIDDADIVLLLVSSSFMASHYCYAVEMTRAMERHAKGDARVIPIILRPCQWQQPPIGKLQALPKDGKPITEWDNQDVAFLDVANGIEKVAQEIRDSSREWEPSYSNLLMPHPEKRFFIGREEFLAKLHQELESEHYQAIHALGGMGKTQVAVEYAYRHKDEYTHILWCKAETDGDLESGAMAIAAFLKLPGDNTKAHSAVAAVKRWLEENSGWLVIFDSVENPDSLKRLMPSKDTGRILLTSRKNVFDSIGIMKPLELPPLSTQDSIDFLFQRSGRTREDSDQSTEFRAAKKIAIELGGLPLALEQAGAYLNAKKALTLRGYLERYKERRLALLEERKPVTGEYPESVATTWSVNFQDIDRSSPESAKLLRVSAFLSPDAIPLELVPHFGLSKEPDELLEPLDNFSLARTNAEKNTYSIHRLVQEVLRDSMSEDERTTHAEHVVLAISRVIPSYEFENWNSWERLISQARAACHLTQAYEIVSEESASVLRGTADYLNRAAQYRDVEPLYRQAIEICRKTVGEEHCEFAETLNNLAVLLHCTGRFKEAVRLCRQAMEIRRKTLGEQHSDFAESLLNLAVFLTSSGHFEEVESLYRQAIEVYRRALGEEHPDYANSLNGLAAFLHSVGRLEESERVCRQGMEIRRKVFGEKHPDYATSMHSLAVLLSSTGRAEIAEPLYRQAMEIRRNVLGQEHPAYAQSLHDLAGLLNSTGRSEKAELLYRQAIEIRGNVLGEEHPDYANSLNSLAALLHSKGRSTEAERLCRQGMEIRRKALGEEHLDYASSLIGMAILLNSRGRSKEAERLCRQAMDIRRKVLGEEHPDFAKCVRVLENIRRTRKTTSNLESSRVGRNDPCPCGSGKKHKKCCGQGSAS